MNVIDKREELITSNGIFALLQKHKMKYSESLDDIKVMLNRARGMLMSSGIEYPGRYNRWEVGFIHPPVEFIAYDGLVKVRALNPRGNMILSMIKPIMSAPESVEIIAEDEHEVDLKIHASREAFPEEKRSFQPSVMTPIRALTTEFNQLSENMLGLFGAFGYALIYQFEPVEEAKEKNRDQKLYHLYWVDELYAIDKKKEESFLLTLELKKGQYSTLGTSTDPYEPMEPAYNYDKPFQALSKITSSMSDDAFANMVDKAREHMRVGDVFEVVLSRRFEAKVQGRLSELFDKMKSQNPSPYEYFCQFGDEQLIGTSPEMFVRVEGDRIESCPISGTIRRGDNAMEDSERIVKLLNSYKDEVELTMCTDVDRNDKSRICQPGSVNLLERRTIERYEGLFHTVDHVEGTLRSEYNGLDAFMSHMWAVTLTGAPKPRAIRLVNQYETMPRNYYGGSVGAIGFNGDINSAITIRTVHIKKNKATYQAGATLVWDSEGKEEAKETHTKATAFKRALGTIQSIKKREKAVFQISKPIKAIMIDHEDSFVHTLADYFRQCGVELDTYRSGITIEAIKKINPDIVIYSPGPGKPQDFNLPQLIKDVTEAKIPQFGVCLGLQGMIEAFGGQLKLLDVPHHGKIWKLKHQNQGIFKEVEPECEVAAYHSIIADDSVIVDDLVVTAVNEHGHIMAVEHKNLPLAAVQFHPESILTMKDDTGLRMIYNAIEHLT
ncbi:MAG: anthranilate synthase component I [Gammaproteobacteria bacterium]|nr:MAG: anthranilate synthase component I [Gammaproteobacteria bacterium]UTW43760.1 anthranilate synthase component I [bacterium SCSIO 12844]